MGSNTSKASTETAVVSQNNEVDKDFTNNPDPRSPTPEITRTPLQNKNGGKHNITKNVDLRKTFESDKKMDEKLIHNNPILSAVIKNHLQSYDPRSPTQDFERTPIVISNQFDGVNDKRHLKLENTCGSPQLNNDTIDNNNCDASLEVNQASPEIMVPKNLFDKFIDLTLDDTLKDNEEPLGSSTASHDVIENDIPKESSIPTKLLETNFDYVEKSEESNIDTSDKCIEKLDCNMKNVDLFKILPDDPRSPSIGIERTPIVVNKVDDATDNGNVEDMSDDSLIKVLQITNSDFQQNELQEKNDGLHVYEEETSTFKDTPKKTKSASDSGSRTPLSCMKNKTDTVQPRSKSTNTLYDTQNKTKPQKRVSHIPRFKSLLKQPKYIPTGSNLSLKNINKSSAISGDCENTPPHSHRDKWDKDNSIVL